MLQRLVQCRPDVAAKRVVACHRLVRALEHDDVLLAGQRLYDSRLGERSNDVDMNRPDLGAAFLAHVVDSRFDVLGRRS